MIYYEKNIFNRINKWSDNTIHILTDFDKTITVGNSDSSWSILSKSNLVPKEYVIERQELFNHYRPIETDETLNYAEKNQLMTEWWNKHINLFVKYKLSETVIIEAAKNLKVMSFREGAKEFLENMRNRNIPVIIISAGIGNFIEQFLIKNNCNFENIHIVSNFIKFENGIAVGVSENVIHSLNKNEVSIPKNIQEELKDRGNIILLGDSISDIKMVKEKDKDNALKIGFLDENIDEKLNDFKDIFDVVCTNNTSYIELFNEISILNK